MEPCGTPHKIFKFVKFKLQACTQVIQDSRWTSSEGEEMFLGNEITHSGRTWKEIKIDPMPLIYWGFFFSLWLLATLTIFLYMDWYRLYNACNEKYVIVSDENLRNAKLETIQLLINDKPRSFALELHKHQFGRKTVENLLSNHKSRGKALAAVFSL